MTAFASFADFVAMGHHGAYVWTAYGVGLLLMALNAVLPLAARRRYLNEQARRRRRKGQP
ncbi:heme exporter protein CcmD [Cupriavidus nantongensis]|uniref:Heme exporter protein D n=1 Tax=Cupriavidus nantongensis TaxID=1796606 RepID=A0A142JKB1_9BURK|nr:heme exporter protein CcmD [Cupriavidus nantongensis]AMR78523.1 heme exporter CcmD [Cupriavidus nantongensis]